MTSTSELTTCAADLKKYNADPVNNVSQLCKVLDILLDGSPTLTSVKDSKILLQVKITGKKTKNDVIKSKADLVQSKYQNLNSSVGTSQMPSRSQSIEIGSDSRSRIKSSFIKELSKKNSDENKIRNIAEIIEETLFNTIHVQKIPFP